VTRSVTQRTLVAQQPTYLPYLGLLDKVARADVFVVQDDLKYVKDEVSNRNRIRSQDGWKWLTIPVHRDDRSTYSTVTVADAGWADSHRRILSAAYRGAPFVDRFDELYELIDGVRAERLSTINLATLRWLLGVFGIDVELHLESDLKLGVFDNPNDRLIALCTSHGCDRYLSGVGGHAYIEAERWQESAVELAWVDYEPRVYDRGGEPWIPNLSAIDAVAWVEDLPSLLS
jgi:hypothetical protein